MTTLSEGNLVQRTTTLSVWRLDIQSTTSAGTHRWMLTMIEPGSDERPIGSQVSASSDWLQLRCVDYVPPTIDPPCGFGVNRAAIYHGSEMVASERFDDADSMIAWLGGEMSDDFTGFWFGWDADVTEDPADMTVTMVEGELVWAE